MVLSKFILDRCDKKLFLKKSHLTFLLIIKKMVYNFFSGKERRK